MQCQQVLAESKPIVFENSLVISGPTDTSCLGKSETKFYDNIDSSQSNIKKNLKASKHIIRSGRTITLPPIEAPTTRSKRHQINIKQYSTTVRKADHNSKKNKVKAT